MIPKGVKEFQLLKGVGPYIASAVQSIAFNIPVSVIDGNINRVVSRFFAYSTAPTKNQKKISEFLDHMLDKNRPGDFNQAMMDLGRYICKPSNPLCDECPLHRACKAFSMGQQNHFPVKQKRKKKPHYDVAVGIIWDDKKLLITKRKEGGLLGGFFPALEPPSRSRGRRAVRWRWRTRRRASAWRPG